VFLTFSASRKRTLNTHHASFPEEKKLARNKQKVRRIRLHLFFSLLLANTFFLFLPNIVSAEIGIENEATFPLKLFLTIAGLTALLFLLGFSQDVPFFTLAGTTLMFFLGFIIINGSLAYNDGTTTENYNYDLVNGSYEVVSKDVTPIYTNWDNKNSKLIGWLMMFISAVLFALTLYTLRGDD
jgi:hypothetical protein